MTEENKAKTGNSKLSTIFLVVLGLHVFVIVMILGYNLLKGDSEAEEASPFTYSPSLPAYEVTESTYAPPQIDTGSAVEEVEPVVAKEAAPQTEMSMPSASDPIWAKETVMPRQPETVINQKVVAAKESVPTLKTEVTESLEKEVEAVIKPTMQTYTVVKGDSLSRISKRYGVSVKDLQAANGLDGSMIKIGQKLNVPTTSSIQVPEAPVVALKQTTVPSGTHVVAKGETLWKIARTYQVKPNDIAQINGISDPSLLKVGQKLKIPGMIQEVARPVTQPVAPIQKRDVAMNQNN